MSDITLINDSEQSSLVTNGLAKNGELYLKKAGSTDAGAIVAYDNGVWRTFANEAVSFANTYSVETDGTNDQLQLPSGLPGSGNRLGITGTSHTICFWMKITGSIPHRISFFYNVNIQIRTRTDGFRFFTSGGYTHHIHTITAGTWYFLALSCNGTSHTSYVKSASDDLSATVTGNSFTPTGYAVFGPSLNANYDEFATFNSALSASDISNIYNSGVPGDLSGYATLAGHWRMGDSDGGTGTTISDEMGGEDITLANGAFIDTDIPS